MASSGLKEQSDEEEQRPLVGITEDAAVHLGSEELRALLKQQREEMHAIKQQQEETNEALKKQQEAHRDELRALETKTNQLEEALQEQQAAAPANVNVNRYRRGRGFSIFFNADGGQRVRENDGDGEDEEHVLEEDIFSMMMLNKYHGVWPHPFPRILQFCIRTLCILMGLAFFYFGIVSLILGLVMIILIPKVARYLPPQISILPRLIPCIFVISCFIYIAQVVLYYHYWALDQGLDPRFVFYYLFSGIIAMLMVVVSRKIAILFKYLLCMSTPWALGMVTFALFQIGLGYAIIYDQLVNTGNKCDKDVGGDNCIPFGIPYRVGGGVLFARFVAAILVLATQTDTLTSVHTILVLRNADHVPWDTVIGQEGNRTWRIWLLYILLPNLLKLIQAVVILIASFIVIVQSKTIIDLLKDSTALLFVSQSDNIIFYLADLGYLGEHLKQKAAEVKAARWPVEERRDQEANAGENSGSASSLGKCVRHYFNIHVFIFFLLFIVMIGSLIYVVAREIDGTWMRMKYPGCDVHHPRRIGDEYCHDRAPYNLKVCGFDGGDCVPKPVDEYPGCMVHNPGKIGNGKCNDYAPYNLEVCGFDGGDCVPKPVDGYQGCMVHTPEAIGNGHCDDYPPYNSEACGWDGGDCPSPP